MALFYLLSLCIAAATFGLGAQSLRASDLTAAFLLGALPTFNIAVSPMSIMLSLDAKIDFNREMQTTHKSVSVSSVGWHRLQALVVSTTNGSGLIFGVF